MVDRAFSETRLAALYDTMCYGRPEFPLFYVPLVMAAESVLDVGCGTGELLITAREAGHTGRLCGVDPADAMLDVARRRDDVEWLLGEAETLRIDSEFELAVMTGNAFQVLVTDEQLRAALRAIRAALVPGGRFAFETRNPARREWERWGPGDIEVDGVAVHSEPVGPAVVEGELLHFGNVFTSPSWSEPEVSYSTLRLLTQEALNAFLTEAGFEVAEQYGDWHGEPVSDSSLEIVTIARRSS